ncbi:MAG: 3-phosphoshikimate 1-carboxyvinyltransferase, partial [Halofilum sp. (in: g-proteobacteria)]
MNSNTEFQVQPGGALVGRLRVPGDKSISHRAIMLGALADGTTEITGFLEGADALGTLAAFQALGVPIQREPGRVVVHGVGVDGLKPPAGPIDLGNSGTSMRLLAGLLVGQPFDTVLTGDASLSGRPMRRVTEPLARMGAIIETSDDGTPPLHIRGGQPLRGIEYDSPIASAQVKSAVLLAGLFAEGRTCVREPAESRDHTERMLAGFGYAIERGERSACLQGGERLGARAVDIPGDISSAAFFLVGASIAPGSDLVLEHVGSNVTRTGVIEILNRMGADIEVLAERDVG